MLGHLKAAFGRYAVLGILAAGWAIAAPPALLARQAMEYVVGPQDVLSITVWDQPDMSGKYRVESDGTIAFPMIGRIKAGGLKIREVETDIKRRLADGYFKNPQLSVAIEQFRSQRVVVVGEVHTPGTYPLTDGMRLIEALAHAGSMTGDASQQAVVVRTGRQGDSDGDDSNQTATSEVLHVDLRKLATGDLAENIRLQDGDTIFVTRMEKVFVLGQVKSPGAYAAQADTTVLQALSLAGGVTDRGSTSRVRIVRTINGKQVELKVKLSDVVQPGDTVIVLERIL